MQSESSTMSPYRDSLDGRGATELAIRTADVVLATGLLAVTIPLTAAVAAAVKLESRGPVLYRGRRVGRGGAEFEMLKFRKMRMDAHDRPLTLAHDGRFTRIGRLLARTKLDELPQLVNVVRGDMSLVGPRPEDPRIVAADRDAFEPILSVRPGITGYAQLVYVNESELLDEQDPLGDYRRRILPAKLRLDRAYVDQRGVATYLRVLVWTFMAVVAGRRLEVDAAGAIRVATPEHDEGARR